MNGVSGAYQPERDGEKASSAPVRGLRAADPRRTHPTALTDRPRPVVEVFGKDSVLPKGGKSDQHRALGAVAQKPEFGAPRGSSAIRLPLAFDMEEDRQHAPK
jgi:hypothetical protein